jgi:hypothetical protein
LEETIRVHVEPAGNTRRDLGRTDFDRMVTSGFALAALALTAHTPRKNFDQSSSIFRRFSIMSVRK